LDNYDRSSTWAAGTIVVLVAICYQFGVFTFNNVAYFGGLIGGINANQPYLDTKNLAQLNVAGIYPGSVFIGQSSAWALYCFMPWAGGVLGAALFWAFFMLRDNDDSRLNNAPTMRNEVVQQQQHQHLEHSYSAAAVQTNVSELTTPFLKQ